MSSSLKRLCMVELTRNYFTGSISPIETDLANQVASLALETKNVQVAVVPRLVGLGASVVKTHYTNSPIVIEKLFHDFRNTATHLDLTTCTNFNGVSVGEEHFTQLQSLKISSPKSLTIDVFKALCKILPQSMKEIEMKSCHIHGEPTQVLPVTERLILPDCNIDDTDLLEISKKMGHTLVELDISNCSAITTFAHCNFPKLRRLIANTTNFFDPGLTNEGLQALSVACPQLEVLELRGAKKVTTLVGCSFKCLKSLTLKSNMSLQNKDMLALSEMCGNTLEELDISECLYISDVKECRFPQLKKLLAANTGFTHEGLQSLCRAAPNLEVLSFYGCQRMRSYKGCILKNLRELNCTCTAGLDNDQLKAISEMCGSTLQLLDLSCCLGITSFEDTYFPSLIKLVVTRNTNFTQESLESVSRVCGGTLQELSISLTAIKSMEESFKFLNLKKLDVSFLPLGNEDIQRISLFYGITLELLAISACNDVTNFNGCEFPKLTKLFAQNKKDLTLEWLKSLSRSVRMLEVLDLSGLPNSCRKEIEYPFVHKTVWSNVSAL